MLMIVIGFGGFTMGVVFWRPSLKRFEVNFEILRASAIENFDEEARHKFFIITLTSMYDLTKGSMYVPKNVDAVHGLWREAEFRYRHWLKEESSKVWAKSPTFTSPNAC